MSVKSDSSADEPVRESMLITADSFEEFSNEMSSLECTAFKDDPPSIISEIQEEIVGSSQNDKSDIENNMSKSESFSSATNIFKEAQDHDCLEDYLHDSNWLNQKKHVFILSSAGKPIYSLHGNEDKLSSLFGVMQALVSFVQSNNDTIKAINAAGVKFVFLTKHPFILVAVSRTNSSVQQIQIQLT